MPPDIVNPYLTGNKGAWRPRKTWAYLTDRQQGVGLNAGANTTTNIKEDGAFNQFSSFWQPSGSGVSPWVAQSTGWTSAVENDQHDPYGTARESKDALGRYDAQQMGYAQLLVTASAQNARLQQIGFEGFEDINYDQKLYSAACPPPPHFSLGPVTLAKDIAHTGKYCLELNDNEQIQAKYQVGTDAPLAATPETQPFKLRPEDCLSHFTPQPGRYV